MFKLIGKLIKFVIILSVILGLLVGALYLGSEVLDLEFCDDIIDGLEDLFDEMFDGSSSSGRDESVLPGCGELKPIDEIHNYENMPGTIEWAQVDSDGAGYVICVVCHWEECNGPIILNVGVSHDGVVKGARVLESSGNEEKDVDGMAESFIGSTLDGLFERFGNEYVNGAIDSYAAIGVGMMDALVCAAILDGEYNANEPEINADENEIYNLAANLIANDNLRKIYVNADDTQYLKRLYKDNGGSGYVAYLVVQSQYGGSETETLVHISNDGEILNINKLVWKTSDAMYGFVPPSEDVVDAFYARLIGAGTYELNYNFMQSGSELVSGATNTSKNLVSSLYEALTFVDEIN